jgi:hypothetical protein
MVSIKHIEWNSSGFMLSYFKFVLAIVLSVIEILIVFILINMPIYNFPHFSKVALICVNKNIIIIIIIIIYYSNEIICLIFVFLSRVHSIIGLWAVTLSRK